MEHEIQIKFIAMMSNMQLQFNLLLKKKRKCQDERK